MSDRKLYEITNDIQMLEDLDIPEDQIADTLDGAKGEFKLKAERVGKFMANLDADIEAIQHEVKRLNNRISAMRNRKESIREYLRQNMAATGITRISCPLFTITLSEGRNMAVIENEAELPEDYIRVKAVRSVDKKMVLEDLKAGEEIPGAVLGKTKSILRIS